MRERFRSGSTAVAGPLPWMDAVQPGFDGEALSELYGGHLAHELEKAVDALPARSVRSCSAARRTACSRSRGARC